MAAKSLLAVVALFACTLAVPAPKYNPNNNSKIIGGSLANNGQFPFIVSVRLTGSHYCGGAILTNDWILTTAQCLFGMSASDYTVVAGSVSLSSGGVERKVSKIHYHEDFSLDSLENDIGMLKLATPLQFSSSIKAIGVETQNIGADIPVTLMGWGTTSYPGDMSNNLRYVRLKTISVLDCRELHSSGIYDSQMCTLTKSGEGACYGDFGGPLVGPDNKVVGIASWGKPCAVGYPDVFTRVSSFNDWIEGFIH